MEQKNPVLSIVVLLIIIAAAVGILFLLFKPGTDDSNKTANDVKTVTPTATATVTATVTPSVTAEPSVTPSVSVTAQPTTTPVITGTTTTVPAVNDAQPPANWKPIENTSQGYTAYRPTGYYFRLFPPDMFVLGIDQSPIPTESEYMGVISMMRLSASNNWDSQIANLKPGYKTITREINGKSWTVVEGATKDSDAFPSRFIKYGRVKVDSKEFMARLDSSSSNYGGYADEFETFITTVVFK